MRSTEKKYYKIKEVSEMLDIPISTLHFWERQFTVLSPRRSRGNDRLYTTDDIEKIKMVHYLVKVRGKNRFCTTAKMCQKDKRWRNVLRK